MKGEGRKAFPPFLSKTFFFIRKTDSAPLRENTSAPALSAASSETVIPPALYTTLSLRPASVNMSPIFFILDDTEANSPETQHTVTSGSLQKPTMSSSIIPISTMLVSNPATPRKRAIVFLPSVWTARAATTALPGSGLGMSSSSLTA